MKVLFSINHHKPTFKNISFWFWLIFPVIIGGIFGALVWFPLESSLTSSGYIYFLEISKLPLGIMSLLFPSAGIYVIHYKSKQTSELILIGKVKELSCKKDNHIDSLISLGFIIHRLKNHLFNLDRKLNNQILDAKILNREFDVIYAWWSSIFNEPNYAFSLSTLYHDLEKADAYFTGANFSLLTNERDFFKQGAFSKLLAELDLIHLKILRNSSHCKSYFLQECIKIKNLYSVTDLDDEKELVYEHQQMEKYKKDIADLESKCL